MKRRDRVMIVSNVLDKLNELKDNLVMAEIAATENNGGDSSRKSIQSYLTRIRFDFVYNSLALTGFSMKELEASVFINKGHLSQEHTLNEYLILKNYYDIVGHLFKSDLKDVNLTEDLIIELHQQLTNGVNEIIDREHNETIQIQQGMFKDEASQKSINELIEWLSEKEGEINPIEELIVFYVKFILTKPFEFGSALISYLILNLFLLKSGFIPIIINRNSFDEYYSAMMNAKSGKYSHIKDFIIKKMMETLRKATDFIIGKEIHNKDELKSRIDQFYNKVRSYNKPAFNRERTGDYENLDIEGSLRGFHSLLDRLCGELFINGELKEFDWQVKSPVRIDNFPIANSAVIVERFQDEDLDISNALVGPTYLDFIHEGSGLYIKLIPHKHYIPKSILAFCVLTGYDKLYLVGSTSVSHIESGEDRLVPNEKSIVLYEAGSLSFEAWSTDKIEEFFANSVDTFLKLIEKEIEERKSSFDFQ
jgi:Fic family protein